MEKGNFTTRPLKDSEGNVLNDYELAKECLGKIDDYTRITNKPSPIEPRFVEWLRDGVRYVDEGKGTFVDYKNSSIFKEFGDYQAIVDNTNRRNDELAKRGAFAPQTVKKERK